MKFALPLSAAALLLSVATAHADCTPPMAVKLPDPNTATLEDMKAASKAVKSADNDVKVYGACLAAMRDAEYDKIGKSITDEQREEIFKRYQTLENDAVDVVVKEADEFNNSVRTWKAAHGQTTPPADQSAAKPAGDAKPDSK